MADAVLALTVLQVVTPVAVAAMPVIWEQIVKVLRRVITRTARDQRQATNLACIKLILDTLGRFPNLSWTSDSHIQALLNHMKIETESLRKMIENDNAAMRIIHKGKFAKNIQSIALMMQILESNVRARQASAPFFQCNAHHDHLNTDRLNLNFYMASQKNLIKDLHVKLCEDNLEPVRIQTREDYEASIEKSGTYPRILYHFQTEPAGASHGYPRILTISRGVRECIELLLKWLRDLKLMQNTQFQNTGDSLLVGVALYDVVTEILPKVLMDHLVARSSTLHPHTAQQFSKNLRFLRSFSVSPTFKAIQGSDGLRLEEEDKVLNIDLRQSAWVTWEDVQKRSLEVGTSSGGATRTASGHIESHECTICGLYIAGHSLGTEFQRHWEACVRREGRLNSLQRSSSCCPVCHLGMDHMSEEERDLHANACLDRDQSGSGNLTLARSGGNHAFRSVFYS